MKFELFKLGDIAQISSGGTPKRSESHYWKNGNISWVKISDIKGKYVDRTEELITDDGLKNSSARLFPKETILYTIFATIGECAILKIDAATNQAIAGLMINNHKVLTEYVYYYLISIKKEIVSNGRGVAQNNINLSLLRQIKIPIPNLAIQKKIVYLLNIAAKLIKKRKAQIAALSSLTQSVFYEMFGDPFSNKKKFPKQTIKGLAISDKNAIKSGPFGSALKKEYYVKTGYKIYGQEQVIRNNFSYGNYYIDEKRYKSLENYSISSGDVLISLVGTFGKISIVPKSFEPGIINPRLMKLSLNKNLILPEFFKFLFEMPSTIHVINSNSHGGTMGIINTTILKNFKIPVPPMELQNTFVEVLKKIQHQEKIIFKSLFELEALSQSIAEKAFKGELFKD